jgi:hypothetical protein
MKKNKNMIYKGLFLFVALFYMISCERNEIKPEQANTSENVTETPPSDKLVGMWVRYWDSDIKDTLRFSDDGTLLYTLGDFYGSAYAKDYYYENTGNYLIDFDDFDDFRQQTHYLEFYDGDTVFTLHNFSFFPGIEPSVVYGVVFKKID